MPQWCYRLTLNRIALLTEGATPEEDAILAAHFAHLQRLLADGVLILAGRTLETAADRLFGIVVFQAETEADARRLMETDPSVAGGVQRAELFPFRVALLAGSAAG